jgi:hypothetical protein
MAYNVFTAGDRNRRFSSRMNARVDLLRPSRDGDQFHYWWAARRCLALLQPDTDLVAIAIEGVPPAERQKVPVGIDVIDVAEYHGTLDVRCAARVRYIQLKHSTRRRSLSWTASELAETLSGFGARYSKLVKAFGYGDIAKRFAFEFISNRPISRSVENALAQLRTGKTGNGTATAIGRAVGLSGEALIGFTRILTLTGGESDYLEQRKLLDLEHVTYLPDRDEDAPGQLKEMVTRRATSEFEGRPEIDRFDVLKALGVRHDELLPAKCLIERPEPLIDRHRLKDIVEKIVGSSAPVIVSAEGGEGKSILATQLGTHMPEGSATFVYDCFGNGGYRSATGYRHRPAEGLVQLANEMAMAGLCAPLIPSRKANDRAYARAFVDRVGQASRIIAVRSGKALLCLVIDAADNAEIIARELQEGPSFPRLLLREGLPANVRLILTARGYRVEHLDPPPETTRIVFGPFSLEETKANLAARYPSLSAIEVAEFHRMTSENPRVQAAALAEGGTLSEVLARLGPIPLKVDDTIALLLQQAVARVRDDALRHDRDKLDRICEALATLRPFVPIDIVARAADVSFEMVRSFVQDLQRPLLVKGDAVQFRDEPTETWFRDKFRPGAERVSGFASRLMPLAADSVYAASALPQLLLEAERFDELVDLALSGAALPADELSRREVELQRLQFAIKAAIRRKRFAQAAQLALKAGNEAAAHDRQQRLLGANTDLAARFIDDTTLSERVSRREVPGGEWTGSEHAYAAALLSMSDGLRGEASSQLRLAYDWLRNWARSYRDANRRVKRVEPRDVAEIAMAELNLTGPEACAKSLRKWTRREMSFAAGRQLVSRLVDACRYNDIDRVSIAARNDLGLILAVCVELDRVGRVPPAAAVRRAVKIVLRQGVEIRQCESYEWESEGLVAVTSLAIAASITRTATDPALGRVLGRYIRRNRRFFSTGSTAGMHDDRDLVMRAYTVRATLLGRQVDVSAVGRLGHWRRSRDRYELDRLKQQLAKLLPWQVLAARVSLRRVASQADVGTQLQEAENASRENTSVYSEARSTTADAIAKLWSGILMSAGLKGDAWQRLAVWASTQKLFIPTHVEVTRRAARTPGFEAKALHHALTAFRIGTADHEHAEGVSNTCISVARAVLPIGEAEARSYFDEAVKASEMIGDENLWRFETLLHLGDVATATTVDDPETAYRLSRAGELTYALVARDKHFDYWHTLEVVTGLSPGSGPAILSRWTDRRFGTHRDLLPTIVDTLLDRQILDPMDALSLMPIRTDWNQEVLLARAMSSTRNDELRQRAVAHVDNYLRFAGGSAAAWLSIVEAAQSLGMNDGAMMEQRRRAERRTHTKTTPPTLAPRSNAKAPDLKLLFTGLDVSIAADLRVAVSRFESTRQIRDLDVFVAEALGHVAPGGEPAFLAGLVTIGRFGAFNLEALLKLAPDEWASRPSVRKSLADLVREVARRDPHATSISRNYKVVDWDLAKRLSGVDDAEGTQIATAAIGDTAVALDTKALFTLAGRLSRLMNPREALSVIQYGLDLYEPLLDPTVGDGQWASHLEPPSSARVAIAGYVWAGLADADPARRWEASHVVRAMCRLDRRELLAQLVDLAEAGEGGPYADQNYHFYRWNGLQWLLIALARAAEESGITVARHENLLRRFATDAEPHVMIRSFAARALLELDRQSLVDLASDERAAFIEYDRPTPQHFVARMNPDTRADRNRFDPDDMSRFLMDMDFDRYWTVPLSAVLGVNQWQVEQAMERVIRHEWALAFTGRWSEDNRAVGGQFDRRHSYHGDAPEGDTLSRYLSYHSIMIAAGKLLATATPDLTQQPNRNQQTFASWLEEHHLTRQDGTWLFDRRDVTPNDVADMPVAGENWIGSQKESDVRRQLQPSGDWITVRASYSRYDSRFSEEVHVTSALATADKARSLARALQIAEQYEQQLPDYESSHDIERAGYQLKGWIEYPRDDKRLDDKDPWAAEMPVGPYSPGKAYKELLGLTPSNRGRTWRGHDSRVHLRAEVWSEGKDQEDVRFGHGRRLLASPNIVDRLLIATGCSLVVQVRLERGRYYDRYEAREKTKQDDSQRTRIFVVEQGGRIWTPRRSDRARQGAD